MRNLKEAMAEKIALLAVSALIAIVAFAIVSPLISFVFAYTPTNTINAITAELQVPGTCTPQVSNQLINFPNTYAGSSVPTNNPENVVDLGNTGSNIYVTGGTGAAGSTGNWLPISSSVTASFLVGNTLWSATSSSTGAIGTQLGNYATNPGGQNTNVPVQANGGGNVIFFGLNVPAGQPPATYNQLITIMLSC
jgi:hypothetical protein